MRQLSSKQADAMRKMRAMFRPIARGLDVTSCKLVLLCQCEADPDCPVCTMFSACQDIETAWKVFCETFDAMLEAGPPPAGPGHKSETVTGGSPTTPPPEEDL